MENIKFKYILKHKGKIKVVFATIEEIEQGKMDEYLMQKSEKFRSEDTVIARNLWIGKLDKNEKEIYDGDIIKDTQGWLWKVFWRDKFVGFYLKKIDDSEWIDLLWGGNVSGLEVIGNIYENPELLK